jgi:hypothetical protein
VVGQKPLNIRELLEEQLAQTETDLEMAVNLFLVQAQTVITLRKDVESLRGSIEAVSRGNGHPYIAFPVVTKADALLGVGSKNGTSGHVAAPKDAPITKTGELRKVLRENPGITTRQAWEKIRDKKLGIKFTLEDVYKTVARLSAKGQVERDVHGNLRLTAVAPEDW